MRRAVLCTDPFGVCQQHHTRDFLQRNAPQGTDRLDCRNLPKLQVRVEKGRILGADDDIGFIQPVERAPRGHAVDRLQ